jgi:ubiquinone/menaquinone biosynthesis C-methylase UbiE
VLRPYTERLLRLAGIQPGMRVLDVGCGAGDVAMLTAQMVGPSGAVTGVDRSAQALALAERRAEAAGLSWTRFHQADLEDFTADGSFDAVIGRYVLIHQADPAVFLRAAAKLVVPGGVLAFHEVDASRSAPSFPEVALWRQVDDWVKQAFRSAAPHADAPGKLIQHFAAAGLPDPELYCEVPVGGGKDFFLYRYMTELTLSLLPIITSRGVSAETVDIDTLEERLREAVVEAQAQVEWNHQFLAVAHVHTRP